MSNFHLHAVRLPGGDRAEDWWIQDGQWSQTPVDDAHPLPGNYATAGLVDGHTHLSMDMGLFGLPDGSEAVIDANVQDKLRQGVTAVRDAGALPEATVTASSSDHITIIPTGKLISPPGHGYPRICTPVTEDGLIDFALYEIAQGNRWVKVIAEFPIDMSGSEMNHFASVPTYSFEALAWLCTAVHAKGARVAMHTATAWAARCVQAGADSIEHGPGLTPEALAEMAQRGIAWVPTLTSVAGPTGESASERGDAQHPHVVAHRRKAGRHDHGRHR
jgi:imidazolonepropionase-like amidohydrolase